MAGTMMRAEVGAEVAVATVAMCDSAKSEVGRLTAHNTGYFILLRLGFSISEIRELFRVAGEMSK